MNPSASKPLVTQKKNKASKLIIKPSWDHVSLLPKKQRQKNLNPSNQRQKKFLNPSNHQEVSLLCLHLEVVALLVGVEVEVEVSVVDVSSFVLFFFYFLLGLIKCVLCMNEILIIHCV